MAIINYILDMGAAVFLPIVMIIIGIAMKMKPRKAVIAGLTLGVAFTSMNIVLGFMLDSISPAAQAFVENTGLKLNAIDAGWSPMAAISWAWPYALLMFPITVGINILMLAFKWTDCLNVDLWNVWGKIFTATMVSAVCGNVVFGIIAASLQVVLELKNADITQKQLEHITKIPGVACTHCMTLGTVFLYPLNRLLDFIPGINRVNVNAAELKKRIGIFGENSVMGFIVGGLIALVGGNDLKGILNTAVQVATALVLFPMAAKLFMQSLAPIADAASVFMKNKFKGRDFYIGLDWPFLAGQAEIWVCAIVLVPISLLLAMVLGKLGLNSVIPLGNIVNTALVVPCFIITGGNLIRMIILGTFGAGIFLIVATSFAPIITELAIAAGGININEGQYLSWFGFEMPDFRWGMAHAFNGEIIGMVVIVLFFSLFFLYKRTMKKKDIELGLREPDQTINTEM